MPKRRSEIGSNPRRSMRQSRKCVAAAMRAGSSRTQSFSQPPHLRFDLSTNGRKVRPGRVCDVQRRKVRIVPIDHPCVRVGKRLGDDCQRRPNPGPACSLTAAHRPVPACSRWRPAPERAHLCKPSGFACGQGSVLATSPRHPPADAAMVGRADSFGSSAASPR